MMHGPSKSKDWAIYDDLSGVTIVGRGQGGFVTREDALANLVRLLEIRRREAAVKLGNARRALTRERKKGTRRDW